MPNSASELTDAQVQDLKDAFELLDDRQTGKLATGELGTVLRACGQNLAEIEFKETIVALDPKSTGSVSWNDFLEHMRNKARERDSEKEIRDAFNVFDKDGSGSISANELRAVMTNLGEKLTDEEVNAMIKEADVDGDGEIDYGEFVKMMRLE